MRFGVCSQVPDSGGTAPAAVAGAAATLEVRPLPPQPQLSGGPSSTGSSTAPSAAPQLTTAAPFQYLVHEQAKALVALQVRQLYQCQTSISLVRTDK
jgi:hypothetical protein